MAAAAVSIETNGTPVVMPDADSTSSCTRGVAPSTLIVRTENSELWSNAHPAITTSAIPRSARNPIHHLRRRARVTSLRRSSIRRSTLPAEAVDSVARGPRRPAGADLPLALLARCLPRPDRAPESS